MKNQSVISRGEALQILKNDLRRRAMEGHAAELNNSTVEKRVETMARIQRDIEKEIRQRAARIEPDGLLH